MRLALLVAALAAAAPVRAAEAPARPAEPAGFARFTNHGRFIDARLSPKGTYLAVISSEGGRRTLSFIRLKDRKLTGRVSPSDTAMIGSFAWVNDERVVASRWATVGTLARPLHMGDLLSIDPEGAKLERIFGVGVRSFHTDAEQSGSVARLLDGLRHDDRHVLAEVGEWGGITGARIRVVKIDVYDGRKSEVCESPMAGSTYLTDSAGEPRIAWAAGDDGKPRILLRDDRKTWRPLTSIPGLDPGVRPHHYRSADRTLEFVETDQGGFGLFAVSVDTGDRRRLAHTRIATPERTLRDLSDDRVVAVASEPDLPEWDFVDPVHPAAKVLAGLLEAQPGRQVELVSRTDDERLAVAWVYGDRDPGRFLLVDLASGAAETILENRPWIVPEQMAEMAAFHIRASDGHPLHGYVSYPPGLPEGARPPLVVLPHGGPFGIRDRWGFDPEVQLLASEGFAVLQVNYRGSGGYGDAYQEAGYRHWGDRMMEDLLDATRWLVKKGKVDGQRICTYGGSFGGYAAVQLAILAPELIRCAAGFAGVYDLTRLERNDDIVMFARARSWVRATTGDDPEALKAASPVFHADRLTAPVLLIHGGKDTRVPIVHAEKLRDALTALGRPPEWLEEPIEGHGFYDEGARLRMYQALVAFLKKHTAPAAAPQAPARP